MKAYLAPQRDWLGGREITWLRARSEPRRDAVGKHQRARTGQPLRSRSWGGSPSSEARHGASAPFSTPSVFLPKTRRSLFLTISSLYYARFRRPGMTRETLLTVFT